MAALCDQLLDVLAAGQGVVDHPASRALTRSWGRGTQYPGKRGDVCEDWEGRGVGVGVGVCVMHGVGTVKGQGKM